MSDLIRRFESFVRISDGGASVSATLDIYREPDGRLRLKLHGDVQNSLVLIGVAGTVIATLHHANGSVYTQVRVDVDEAPPRPPFGGPTARGHTVDVVLATSTDLAQIGTVRFDCFDRKAPAPVTVSDIKNAADLVLPLLLAA